MPRPGRRSASTPEEREHALRLITELERRPERIDRYVARKVQEGLRPKTVSNQIVLLQLMLKRAIRWRLMHSNPVEGCERPRDEPSELNILTASPRSPSFGTPMGVSRRKLRPRSAPGGGSRARSRSSRSEPRCAAASSSPFAG